MQKQWCLFGLRRGLTRGPRLATFDFSTFDWIPPPRLVTGNRAVVTGQEILLRLENHGSKVMNVENEKFQEIVIEHLIRLTQSEVEIKGELGSVKGQIGTISDRLDSLEATVLRIENDHGEKLQALFDAREAQLDVNKQVIEALQRIEGKVDLLTLKISAHDAILGKAR